MTPREALDAIYSCTGNWELMKTIVSQASVAVDMGFQNGHEIMKLEDIDSSYIDDRYNAVA